MYDHGKSLKTILVHSIILKKDVCDLGEEFEYKILHFRLFQIKRRILQNLSTLIYQFFQFRNVHDWN